VYWVILIFWALGFLVLWKIPVLRNAGRKGIHGPTVSVVIPARNEERTLDRLLGSLASQTCPPREITVVNDHSTDGTPDIALAHDVRVIPAAPLPHGWLGKPWACQQGAEAATGDLLLFLDADTFLEPDGVAKIVNEHDRVGGLISVQPYHLMEKAFERLAAFFNIITMAGTGAFTPAAVNIAPRGAFGPCLLCSRRDYFAAGGHARARAQVLESMGLAHAFREARLPVTCCGGRGAVSFRMYPDGLRSMIDGFSKGFAEGASLVSLPALILLVAWVTGGASSTRHLIQFTLGFREGTWALWIGLYAGFSAQIYWMLRRIGNFGLFPCILYPVPLLFFAVVFFRSLLAKMGVGKILWKSRRIEGSGR
jgi:4,4'-diaponeurosporenoate glycosyltransferase